MKRIGPLKLGALCALGYGIGSGVFFALYIAQGNLQVDWGSPPEALLYMSDNATAGATVLQLWLSFALPVLMSFAGLGFFHALRHAGPSVLAATVAFVSGGFLIIHRGFIGVAWYELGSAYPQAADELRQTLVVLYEILMTTWDAGNIVGGVLAGIGTLLFSLALLRSSFGPRWLGWLGIFVAVFGGLMWVFAPLSEAVGITVFMVNLVFFVWMSAMGIVLWRAPDPAGGAR